MGSSDSIAPVTAIPAVVPVTPRNPRQQQADNENDDSSKGKPLSEEKPQATDDNKKPGGLDCYA
ncbi:hypothetical protein Ga0123461_0152 [Mariprofundus aestuarium]|uniref:Uncharacterized protein n=1 Tax=Mariprofundus aestuarium TaxID=1921086 RepID=A0A2K8KUZ7_MARES|nr:hypothetical protein [Mariprofundus aestuarium]ATX78605.1 hypothetical protein Ga0123461_0152 [Mariprofundus aestuarium]